MGSSPHLLTALSAQRLARSLGVPFVAEVRDLWPQSLVDLGLADERDAIVRISRWVERRVYAGSDHIVTTLPNAAEYFGRFGVDPAMVTCVPNGVDLDEWPEPTPTRRAMTDPFRIAYAGAHGLPNGLDTLIDAGKLLSGTSKPEIVIDLYGFGVDRPRLMRRAKDEGLTNVRFHDPVPKERVPEILQSADALVLLVPRSPLYRYGISMNKLFDYLAAGRPVLMAADVFNDPVAEAGAGLSVPPEDPRALADAMLDDRITVIGDTNCRAIIFQHFILNRGLQTRNQGMGDIVSIFVAAERLRRK